MTSYYAHSNPSSSDKSTWQPLYEHLNAVGEIAAECAKHFASSDIARVTGLLHDLGKYSAEFQARLEGNPARADHATAGAQLAYSRFPFIGKLIAFAVAGHHAGLANGIDEGEARSTLQARLELKPGQPNGIPATDSIWSSEIELPEAIALPALKQNAAHGGFQLAFFVRMIFSCLIHADRTGTQRYIKSLEPLKTSVSTDPTFYPSLGALRTALNNHLR